MARSTSLTLIFGLSVLTACAQLAPGGAAQLDATGISGAYSRQVIVATGPQAAMVGQVLILRQDGRIALIAEIGQAYRSGLGRPRFSSAWDEGRELAFAPASRSERFCMRGAQCQGYRVGTLALTADTFDAALVTGLTATLIGDDNAVEVHFPAHMFRDARDRARAAGLWTS